MKRRDFLVGMAVSVPLALAGGGAFAQSFAEDLIAQLTAMGFDKFEVYTTWLGRVRILATRSDGVREIVLNPRTGEILRDFWTPTATGSTTRVVLDDLEENLEDGSGDDSDDDHSGSGSSGSGSGSSGSSGSGSNSGSGSSGDDGSDDHEDPEKPEDDGSDDH